jgi:hypothetical protein
MVGHRYPGCGAEADTSRLVERICWRFDPFISCLANHKS